MAEHKTENDYRPEHCPTCRCEPVGPLPDGVPVDPYCPEHGNRPTAYSDCSCLRRVSTPPEKST